MSEDDTRVLGELRYLRETLDEIRQLLYRLDGHMSSPARTSSPMPEQADLDELRRHGY